MAKTYKYDGFSHQLMFAMLGYIAVIPVQIILDQRECIIQGGDSLNVVYENGSYITAENFILNYRHIGSTRTQPCPG